MYTEIPSLTRCCFCVPLRYGLIVWAYLKLVFNLVVFGLGLIWLSGFGIFIFFSEYAMYILLLFASVLLLFFCDIIFSFALIVGIHKKHTTLLRIFIRFGVTHVALVVTVCVMILAFLISTTTEIHRDGTLHFIFIFVTVCSSFIIIQTYLLLLVRSEMLKLKANGQFHFVNHTTDPECTMQADVSSADKEKEIVT